MSRWGETFAALSGGSDTLDTIRHSGDPLSIVSQSVNSVTAAPTPSVPSIPPAVDRALAIWGEAEAERAVIVGDEGAIPRIGIPEIPEEPVLLRDGRSLGSVATTARLIMIACVVSYRQARARTRCGGEGISAVLKTSSLPAEQVARLPSPFSTSR